MAVTVAKFQQTFSEFRKTDPEEIQAKLTLAALRVNTVVWGARADFGILYMTAHLLALAPDGQNAKLMPGVSANTVYLDTFNVVKKAVTVGYRQAGQPLASAFNDFTNNRGFRGTF